MKSSIVWTKPSCSYWKIIRDKKYAEKRRANSQGGTTERSHTFLGKVTLAGQIRPRYQRVVTLADGETIHNAFFDRRFREEDRP